MLREMTRIGRFGISCVDLARSRLAIWAIWLVTALFLREPMIGPRFAKFIRYRFFKLKRIGTFTFSLGLRLLSSGKRYDSVGHYCYLFHFLYYRP